MVAALALLTAGCALDPFDNPTEIKEPSAADRRVAEQRREAAIASAKRSEALLYTAPIGAIQLGAWSGYGDYEQRRVSYVESFWASTWPPGIITAEFRQRFPDFAWADQPGIDPAEFVIVGRDPDNYVVVVYAHPTRTRYLTGTDAGSRTSDRAAPPAGAQSFITIAVIHAGAVATPTAPTITAPASPPS